MRGLVSGKCGELTGWCERSPVGLDNAVISMTAAAHRRINTRNATDSAAENRQKITAHRSDPDPENRPDAETGF